MEMAKIGPGIAGGNNRQTLTDFDAEGRALFQRWCEAEGLTMAVDKMGTMFMRREGTDPSLPPVCIGSHLPNDLLAISLRRCLVLQPTAVVVVVIIIVIIIVMKLLAVEQ